MKTKEGWHRHLIDLVGANVDPTVYAVQWTRERNQQWRAGERSADAIEHLGSADAGLWAGRSAGA